MSDELRLHEWTYAEIGKAFQQLRGERDIWKQSSEVWKTIALGFFEKEYKDSDIANAEAVAIYNALLRAYQEVPSA